MLTEGFFLIKSNIRGWWIWMYYIGFHTYSFESFMYNEFQGVHRSSSLCTTPSDVCNLLGERVLSFQQGAHLAGTKE